MAICGKIPPRVFADYLLYLFGQVFSYRQLVLLEHGLIQYLKRRDDMKDSRKLFIKCAPINLLNSMTKRHTENHALTLRDLDSTVWLLLGGLSFSVVIFVVEVFQFWIQCWSLKEKSVCDKRSPNIESSYVELHVLSKEPKIVIEEYV